MVSDRHQIKYNAHSRSFIKKAFNSKKDCLNSSLFINQDKFLDIDDESMISSDEEDFKRKTSNNNDNYSCDQPSVQSSNLLNFKV